MPGGCQGFHGYLQAWLASRSAPPKPKHLPQAHRLAMSLMPDKRSTSEKRNNKRFTPYNEVRRSFQITRGRFSLKVLFQQFIRDARDTEWQVKERGNILFDTYTLCFHELTHIFLVVMINIHPVNLVSLLFLATTLVGKSSNQRPFPNSVVCFMQYLSPLDTRVDCTLWIPGFLQ